MKITTTILKEYDSEGKLIKHTETTVKEEITKGPNYFSGETAYLSTKPVYSVDELKQHLDKVKGKVIVASDIEPKISFMDELKEGYDRATIAEANARKYSL
jgi:hypothetical protein